MIWFRKYLLKGKVYVIVRLYIYNYLIFIVILKLFFDFFILENDLDFLILWKVKYFFLVIVILDKLKNDFKK